MNQKFDLIIYGDFFGKQTSQAENMQEVISVLSKQGLLGRVICRDANSELQYVRALPGGAFFIKALTLLEVLFGCNLRNFSQNTLFDFFASKKISSQFVIASVSGLRRCLATTKKQGGIFIEMALMENPEIFQEKLIQESLRHQITIQKNTSRFLNELSYTMRRADWIIAIAPFVKQSLVKRGLDSNRILVSGLGIDESVYYPKKEIALSTSKKFRVLYLAHTQLLKGLQDLLEVWIRFQGCNIELVVVGLIDRNTEQVIERYRSLKGVIYLGAVRDTLSQYQQADLFVFPTYSDGLGKAAVEAMACGLPVIITNQCGIEITDGKEGFIISAGDTLLLEEKIRFCYNTPDITKKMGQSARETFLKQYTSVIYKKKIIQIIQKILTYGQN